MKHLVIAILTLLSFGTKSQTIIGINGTVGASKITNEFQTNLSPENVIGGNAFGLAANANFIASKRFNPKLTIGFMKKTQHPFEICPLEATIAWEILLRSRKTLLHILASTTCILI